MVRSRAKDDKPRPLTCESLLWTPLQSSCGTTIGTPSLDRSPNWQLIFSFYSIVGKMTTPSHASGAGPAILNRPQHLFNTLRGAPSAASPTSPSSSPSSTRYATRPAHSHYTVPDSHFEIISDEIQAALGDPPSSRRTHIIRDRIEALQ